MRSLEHMDLLNEWRDDVVRDGERGPTWNWAAAKSSQEPDHTCMDCHTNKDEFCDRCHTTRPSPRTAGTCHVEPEEA
jgi:hypothetical protein